MSIILEFTIAAEDFHLGKVLSHSAQMQFELERIVPTGTMTMPFIWVTGETHEAFDVFEENVQTNPAVEELLLLDRLDTSRLYRVEWKEQSTDLIDAIAQAEASVLQARGKDD